MPRSWVRWAGLALATGLAIGLNGYAFVLYELVECDALDGRGIAGDGRLAVMCGRDNSLASVGFLAFVAVGVASLAGLVGCWRRDAVPARVLGLALLLLAPVVAFLALALITG